MDREATGFGGSPYEYIVTEQGSRANRARRVLLILGYILYAPLLLMLGVTVRLLVPFLCLIPLSLWVIVFFTWRFTQTEYRISLLSGHMTVTRFYGGRNKKQMLDIAIKEILRVCPYTEDEAKAIPKGSLCFRATDGTHGTLCILFLKGQRAVILRLDEKAERLIRKYNRDCFAS